MNGQTIHITIKDYVMYEQKLETVMNNIESLMDALEILHQELIELNEEMESNLNEQNS